MTGLPAELVVPRPNMIDREFWAHCAQRRLMFQACGECGLLRHPPTPFCSSCQSTRLAWREAPSVGAIYSYTISFISQEHGLKDTTPYTIAIVEFPDFGPVRLVTNVEADVARLKVGLKVELFWLPAGTDIALPLFRPVEEANKARSLATEQSLALDKGFGILGDA